MQIAGLKDRVDTAYLTINGKSIAILSIVVRAIQK